MRAVKIRFDGNVIGNKTSFRSELMLVSLKKNRSLGIVIIISYTEHKI